MAFDTILSKLKTPEKPPGETFFALEVTSETIKSAVWLVENKQTQVLKVGKAEEWKEQDKESFLKAVDASISSAGEGIVPEPKGILFGLPEDWVNKDEILPQRKELLRQVSQKLELKPLGFVVTVEALVQYFKAQQGTPLNAVLIRMGETDLLVSLVVIGKVKGSEIVGRTEDLVADVKEGLARFSVDTLPPRLILYNGLIDFEDAKQQLLSYDWQKELSFLHFPKIESLASETSIKAVAVSGGGEVAKSLGLEVVESQEQAAEEAKPEPSAPEPEVEPALPEEKTEKGEKETGAEEVEPPDLPEAAQEEEKPEEAAGEEVAALGFVKGKDILVEAARSAIEKPVVLRPEKPAEPEARVHLSQTHEERPGTIKLSQSPEPTKSPKTARLVFLTKVGQAFGAMATGLRRGLGRRSFRLPLGRVGGLALIVGGVFAALIVGGFLFYWYVPKAEVTVYVAPKILEKELSFTVDTAARSVDTDQAVLPGKTQEIESQGNLTATTTGKKLIGDAATGDVTILNKTNSRKSFEKGTVLVGPDNLRFELSQDVTVASKSSELVGDGEKITYGKATVAIEAADIGPEYNVGSGTEFSFKDFSTSQYSAKTDEGLSGGTSREIQAVSEADQEGLLDKLTNQLKTEAEGKLESQVGGDQNVLPEAMEAKVVKESFNHDVGDEAQELSLDLTVTLTALSFSQNDLNTLLLHRLSGSLPGEFQLTTEDIDTRVEKVEVGSGKATINLIAQAKLLPKYDLDALREDLVGKFPPLVQGHLSTLPNFVKADIKITPRLPGKLGTLPRVKEKIKITVEATE